MEPLVSIVCLTYNHAPFVRNALDGFLMQKTNFPFEVILHDDASTDGTQDIVREYERAYPDIFNVIYQKENQYSKTKSFVDIERKFMEPRIRGKYIAACEGDDYWFHPDKLQMQADYMEKHPDCSLTFHSAVWLNELYNERVFTTAQISGFEKDYYGDDIIAPSSINIPTNSRMARADISKEWPKFRLMANIGDYPSQCHLAVHGYIHYFPNVMSVYRWNHPESWNRKFNDDRNFAINNSIIALRWMYEFHLYCKGKFVVAVGKVMMFHVVMRLDRLDAVNEFPWLEEIVIAAHGKKGKMVELKKLAEEQPNNKIIQEKFQAAEKEYYTWFVNAIGEGIKRYDE